MFACLFVLMLTYINVTTLIGNSACTMFYISFEIMTFLFHCVWDWYCNITYSFRIILQCVHIVWDVQFLYLEALRSFCFTYQPSNLWCASFRKLLLYIIHYDYYNYRHTLFLNAWYSRFIRKDDAIYKLYWYCCILSMLRLKSLQVFK